MSNLLLKNCQVVLALGFLQTCSGAHLKVENKEHMVNVYVQMLIYVMTNIQMSWIRFCCAL